MGINPNCSDKPITKKQAKFLHDLACKSFSQLTRGEAFDMIQRWSEDNERCSYDNDILEENK